MEKFLDLPKSRHQLEVDDNIRESDVISLELM